MRLKIKLILAGIILAILVAAIVLCAWRQRQAADRVLLEAPGQINEIIFFADGSVGVSLSKSAKELRPGGYEHYLGCSYPDVIRLDGRPGLPIPPPATSPLIVTFDEYALTDPLSGCTWKLSETTTRRWKGGKLLAAASTDDADEEEHLMALWRPTATNQDWEKTEEWACRGKPDSFAHQYHGDPRHFQGWCPCMDTFRDFIPGGNPSLVTTPLPGKTDLTEFDKITFAGRTVFSREPSLPRSGTMKAPVTWSFFEHDRQHSAFIPLPELPEFHLPATSATHILLAMERVHGDLTLFLANDNKSYVAGVAPDGTAREWREWQSQSTWRRMDSPAGSLLFVDTSMDNIGKNDLRLCRIDLATGDQWTAKLPTTSLGCLKAGSTVRLRASLKSHAWCVAVCEKMGLHSWLRKPSGFSLSVNDPSVIGDRVLLAVTVNREDQTTAYVFQFKLHWHPARNLGNLPRLSPP